MQHSKKFGGRTSTSGANRNGSGPVYEIGVALGITQQEFSDALGMSLAAVQKMEREGRAPKNKLALHVLRQMAWRMDAGEKRTNVLEELQ